MKKFWTSIILLTFFLASAVSEPWMMVSSTQTPTNDSLPEGEVPQTDTLTISRVVEYYKQKREKEKETPDERPIHSLHLLTRSYGDRIVLRWAYEEFAVWQLAGVIGIDVLRTDLTSGDLSIDTIARNIKIPSEQAIRERFPQTDTLAWGVGQIIHMKGSTTDDLKPGPMGFNISDLYMEQQTRYAYALLISEWRPDLADVMAMRYEDRDVKPGHKYHYMVTSHIPDSVMHTRPGVVEVENVPYKAPVFAPVITDTVAPSSQLVRLYWGHDENYSAYDVERRINGGEWKQVNSSPVITLQTTEYAPANTYTDEIDDTMLGTYEYRVRGYDAFGEKSNWSDIHLVKVGDKTPPVSPDISLFSVSRGKENKDSVTVTIHWRKGVMEEDFVGYNIYYFHESLGHEWFKVNPELIPPTDTTYTTEVVPMSNGFVIVAAVDKEGNEGISVPRAIDLQDYTPPAKPTGLRHLMNPNGTLILRWDGNTEPDLKGYQLYKRNDPTHVWQPVRDGLVADTIAFDTIAVRGLNQRYIYYGVQAIDYAGNASEMSEQLRVQRVSLDKPQHCIIDTLWQDSTTLYMDWQCQDEHIVSEYRLYRSRQGSEDWEMVQIVDADSVENCIVHTQDSPAYDRSHKYYYCIEPMGISGIKGDMSHPVSFKHQGPMEIEVKINLKGELTARHQADLQWSFEGDVPANPYFQLQYLTESGQWANLTTHSIDELRDARLQLARGETKSFRVLLRWTDGLRSTPSNVVTLTNKEDER